MKGDKPRRSKIRTAFVIAAAALGFGISGGITDQLPKDTHTGTQKIFGHTLGANVSASDQLWKNTLDMKSVATRGGELVTNADKGDNWRVRTLLEHDGIRLINESNYALGIAALRGHADVVDTLVLGNAYIDAYDGQAFINAVRGNHWRIINQLYNLNADVETQENEALMIAAAH